MMYRNAVFCRDQMFSKYLLMVKSVHNSPIYTFYIESHLSVASTCQYKKYHVYIKSILAQDGHEIVRGVFVNVNIWNTVLNQAYAHCTLFLNLE